jgi:hypothetical protein
MAHMSGKAEAAAMKLKPKDEAAFAAPDKSLSSKVAKRFSSMLDDAFETQYIGKNRANPNSPLKQFENERKEWQKAKNEKLSDLLGDAFGSQFIGKNRASMGMVGQGQFDKWAKTNGPQTKPIRVIMEKEMIRGSSPFGGDAHYAAMVANRGAKVGGDAQKAMMALQQKQLTALELIAKNTVNKNSPGTPIP